MLDAILVISSFFLMLNLKKNLFFIILILLFTVGFFLTISFYFFIYKNYFNFSLDSLSLLVEALIELIFNFSLFGYYLYYGDNSDKNFNKSILESQIKVPNIINKSIDYNELSRERDAFYQMNELNDFIRRNSNFINSNGDLQEVIEAQEPIIIHLSNVNSDQLLLSLSDLERLRSNHPIYVPTTHGCYIIDNNEGEIRSYFASANSRNGYIRNNIGNPILVDELGVQVVPDNRSFNLPERSRSFISDRASRNR